MSKKILAVLICCALALGSVFCFAGCDNKESELQALRQSTENLQQSNEELKQSLTELQEILKKQNEQLKRLEDDNSALNEKLDLYYSFMANNSIYSLQEEYDKMLSYNDLLSIAFYHNGGRKHNEEIIGEDFIVKPKYPEQLNETIQNAIKQTYYNKYLYNDALCTVDDVFIDDYYGIYNGYIVVLITQNNTGCGGYEPGITCYAVNGVTFEERCPKRIYIWG